MPNRLHVSSIKSIGTVEEGDDPLASILLYKSLPDSEKPEEPREGRVEKEGADMEHDLSALDPATREYVEALIAKSVEVDNEPPVLPDDLPEPVAKRLDDLDAMIVKEREEKEQLAKQLARIEDERATEKYTKMAEQVETLLGDAGETAPLFKTLGAAAPESFDALFDRIAKTMSLAKFDALLKEHGDTAADGNAVEKINAYASEIRKANPDLSHAEARAQAWREHPDLKVQAREEGVA